MIILGVQNVPIFENNQKIEIENQIRSISPVYLRIEVFNYHCYS